MAKVLEPGKDLLSGQRILDLMYQLPAEYDDSVNQEIDLKYGGNKIPKEMLTGKIGYQFI